MNIIVPRSIVETTLDALRQAGRDRDSEAVLLWLGRAGQGSVTVVEAYMPEQKASHDYFRIPPKAMSVLLRHLGETKTFIAAQIHSHPEEAFHSCADDTWAIVRHEGALSLVLPYFARNTSIQNFHNEVAAFRLSTSNEWQELRDGDRARSIQIT